jgi:phosphopentomutase
MSRHEFKRVIIIVLDSFGAGAMPDAAKYDDKGADTFGNILKSVDGFNLPNLDRLGLSLSAGRDYKGIIDGCYGRMAELSPAKDTTTGHWEMTGLVLKKAFPTYPDGFPLEIINTFEEQTGHRTIGNYASSGTQILEDLGREHMTTGRLIIYTSADSVFQIAAHQDVVSLNELYRCCEIARKIMTGKHAVGRIIARPFTGKAEKFTRNNAGRKDFSLEPPGKTVLDLLYSNGLKTLGIGKIGDIFGHRGLSEEKHTGSNKEGMDATLAAVNEKWEKPGLIFTNLVDFDMVYGHRRNAAGYAKALMEFDSFLPELTLSMADDDLLIITADHGCDPTHMKHTDHTREYVPLLVWGMNIGKNHNLGIRNSFADCGQTVAEIFGVGRLENGTSFMREILI